jgi:glycosyltransferase involved in cell wall biosynthesis
MKELRVLMVHNFATHYTAKLFACLAARVRLKVIFFSGGGEWYWLKQTRVKRGLDCNHQYLRGVSIFGSRITPGLIIEVLFGTYDVVIKCINGRFALPLTFLCAKVRGKPFVLYTGVWTRIGSWVHRAAFPIVRFIYTHSDAVVVYGEHVKRYLITEGVDPARIFVAPHAADNELYGRPVAVSEIMSVRAQLGLASHQQIVLYVGQLVPVKGIPYLIEAFSKAECKDGVLVLVGSGSEREALENLVKESGCSERIRFVGYVPPERTMPYFAAATVLVVPSVSVQMGKETWGLIVNEAYNQGLPVIASEAVGAAAGGLVKDGVNGIIVPEKSAEAIARALNRILGDRDYRDRLGRAARDEITNWTDERRAGFFVQAVEYARKKAPLRVLENG